MSNHDPLQTNAYEPAPVATANYSPSAAMGTLVRLLDEYLAELQAGRNPDRERLRAEHPELAAELEQCLSGIDFVHRAATNPDSPVQLGDFRIVREVGRGGMGVVYEAEQLSLRRRVALKILRFGGVADPEAMQRFQREAETVARLHHTNVVPIFAVGNEQGVHYYAMQYIEGRTLAAELQDAPNGIEPRRVAALALQAAEALAHAHQRGVIHRDIKPSNLLLDRDGVVWLTDFGLARRIDEVTLTVTGALMGTPRYMSPEQAAATKQLVDHRTDIYSLGATLYELLTGKPVFDAETPQGVITQILNTEPVAPRRWAKELPAELETIVLTCLAKEPQRRYATAQDLADDLRAFLDGRPIRARRPTIVERAVRWARKHRRSAALMSVAAAAAVLLTIGGLFALEQYRNSQTGQLILDADMPLLIGELLDEDGQSVQGRFTIPTEEPLSLPAGSYQLRVSGRGYLDETFQIQIERGQSQAFTVSLKNQRLWEPIHVEGAYDTMWFGEREDILVLAPDGVTRRHGGTGAVLWTTKLAGTNDPRLVGFTWEWSTHGTPSGRNELDRRPLLLHPGPDLDGDGVPDLVWINRRQAAVLALSGKTGKVLWCFQGPPSHLEQNSRFTMDNASSGITLGVSILPDVNGDQVADLVATFAMQKQADGKVPRWVQTISGRTGESLWRYDLVDNWFEPTPGEKVPDDALWNHQIGIASSVGNSFSFGGAELYNRDWMRCGAESLAVPYPAEAATVRDRASVVLVAGHRVVALDPARGQLLGEPLELGFWPIRAPQIANLDGHGKGSVLLLGNDKETQASQGAVERGPVVFTRGDDYWLKLVAVSLATRERLWEAPFRGYWGWAWYQEPFTWPVVADLDGDGRPEVIVPTADFENGTKWSGIQVCDGATGAVRWTRKLSISSAFGQVQQVNRILVGPWADVDGSRPIFTAVLDGDNLPPDKASSIGLLNFDKDYGNPVLLVDALSGKDGRTLWWTRQRLPGYSLTNHPRPGVGPLSWWHAGADGWPELLVPIVPGWPQREVERQPVYVLSGRTGRVLRAGPDFREVRTLDLDGDGTLDFLSFRPDKPDAFDQGGVLEPIRGRSPEAWRHIGGAWQVAGDLDGDGIPDVVTALPDERPGAAEPSGSLRATERSPQASRAPAMSRVLSGRDGRILWQKTIEVGKRRGIEQETFFTNLRPFNPGIDLDGDGAPDLLATGKSNWSYSRDKPFSPLLAVSGRTGKTLWKADLAVKYWNGPQLLECRDLDGDGRPEVLFVSAMDLGAEHMEGISWDRWHYWLTVLSGRDGKVIWKQTLNEGSLGGNVALDGTFSCVFADLNGDGMLDIVIEAGQPGAHSEVRAFSGKDGSLLWRWKPPADAEFRGSGNFNRPQLAVGDLDGSGRPTVLLLHNVQVPRDKGRGETFAELLALEGASGAVKWTWRKPVDSDYNSSNGAIHSRATPLIVRLAEGKRGVCVWTHHYEDRSQIFLLDSAGNESQRLPVTFRLTGDTREQSKRNPQLHYSPWYGTLFRVWAVDLDGQGTDDLVYFSEDRLCVLSEGLRKTRYEWPLPDAECGLLEVSPKTANHPALLAVRAGGRVVFLGASPERPYLQCVGPGTPRAVAWGEDGPRILYELGHEITVSRLAEAGTSDERRPALLSPVGEDPRFEVPLPWYPLPGLPPIMPPSPVWLSAVLLVCSLAVLVVPWWWVHRTVRRRAWTQYLLVLIWLALIWGAGLLLAEARFEQNAPWVIVDLSEWSLAWRVGFGMLVVAFIGMPVYIPIRVMVTLVRRRKWARLGVLLGCILLLAVAIACTSIRLETLYVRAAEQHYSWHGWWTIGAAGVYAFGLAILMWYAARGMSRLGRRGVRRVWRLVTP